MNLPELLSEQQIRNWLQGAQKQLRRYGRTLWVILRSPTSVVRHWMRIRPARSQRTLISPFPFLLLTLVLASLLQHGAMTLVGVDEPFFRDLGYYARTLALQNVLGKSLPGGITVSVILCSLKFGIVLMLVVTWARVMAERVRQYWTDVRALSYLVSFALIADILGYSAVNILYRIIGDSALFFATAMLTIMIALAMLVYGCLLVVVERVYGIKGWRRVVHAAGYVIFVPLLLFFLQTAIYIIPVGISVYRVMVPAMEGQTRLVDEDFQTAETLFRRAIRNDVTGFWCGGAQIRLISVDARRILALLPNLSFDSGMRERLLRRLAQTDPFQRVFIAWKPEGQIDLTPTNLLELREAILEHYLIAGDIPVTSSELDCALRQTAAAAEGCDQLPKDAMAKDKNNPVERLQLYYFIFRLRALKGEPSMADCRRYLQFLVELPIRIELQFVRYRALNLMRDSETLAFLDDQGRHGLIERDHLIEVNRQMRNQGAKYPHLKMPDSQIEKLTDEEFGFYFRQAYLSYLRAEAQLLAESPVTAESSLLKERVASIDSQLDWVAKDVMYRGIPPPNDLERELIKVLGLD